MVESSTYGSGEGSGWETGRSYSTAGLVWNRPFGAPNGYAL